ncbi:MAG: acyl-CoA dehydrogenase family protein [Oscillospiraceae bacterium]|nr:acyl-CoA dehydrogenase family protein [Oscillospiraceae bacterium]
MYSLTEEQKSIRREIREFVDREIIPEAENITRGGECPTVLMKRISELGYCALPFPEELGGRGKGIIESTIFTEEISRGLASLGFIYCAHILPSCYMAMSIATEKQKREWLVPAVKGQKLLTFAITEERGGSDAFGVDTVAEPCPEGWRLNGKKVWITNAGIADGYIINAKTSAHSRTRDVSLFYVDAKTPGLITNRETSIIGLKNSPTGTLTFNNCVIPRDALLGHENRAYGSIKYSLNLGRLSLSAVSVGMAQAAMETAVSYAAQRENRGINLFAYQGVSFPLAEMYSGISVTRNMLYHVADLLEKGGENVTVETASLKLQATEMCQKACREAVLIHGGTGLRNDCTAGRLLLDSQSLTIAEGTSQICKLIIANALNGSAMAK